MSFQRTVPAALALLAALAASCAIAGEVVLYSSNSVDAINAAETLQASGADKRQAAFNQISSDLKGKGIGLEQSAINLGIELVVGLLKAKTPA